MAVLAELHPSKWGRRTLFKPMEVIRLYWMPPTALSATNPQSL